MRTRPAAPTSRTQDRSPRHSPRVLRHLAPLAIGCLVSLAIGCLPTGAAASPYDGGASVADLDFAGLIGAEAGSAPGDLPAMRTPDSVFGGQSRLTCSGVDLHGFLRSFDAGELLGDMRDAILGNAQAAATNYLIALAYSSPTLVSVLDMMERKYSARHGAFLQACNAQQARAQGLQQGARRMAEAGDQCYEKEVGRGTAPSEAFRRCSLQHEFGGFDLPAAVSTVDFLRRYTTLSVSRDVQALLTLLPDERIVDGAYQYKAPRLTVAAMAELLRGQTRAALDRIDAGRSPSAIAPCGPARLLEPGGEACLPPSGAALVASPAYRGASLLSPPARELFKDTLARQIAISAVYANLLDLYQQAARMDARPGAGANADDTLARRRRLLEEFRQLLDEAELQVKAMQSRQQLARTQLLAIEQGRNDLDRDARSLAGDAARTSFSLRGLLHWLGGG